MTIDRFLKISFLVFGLFPIIPFKLKGLPVAILVIFGFIVLVKNKFKDFNLKLFLLFTSLFFINLLSIVNTFNYPHRKVETMLSLLLVPLAFMGIGKLIKEYHKKFFALTFIASSTILAVYHIIFYYATGLFHEPSLRVNSFRKAVSVEIPVLADHTIYVSIFLGLGIFLILNYFKHFNTKIKLGFLLTTVLMVIDLLLISTKGVVVAIFFSVLVYFFLIIKNNTIKIVVVVSSVALFLLSIMYLPTLERRFRELRIASTYNKIQPDNSSSVRIGIYTCVLKAIKEKPILGYGLGTDPMLDCYKETSDHLYNYNFGSHNQYFGYMLNAGIFGLITLLGFMFLHFKRSIHYKEFIYFIITLFYALVMLTENILERQSGLILFIFVMCLLYYPTKNNEALKS